MDSSAQCPASQNLMRILIGLSGADNWNAQLLEVVIAGNQSVQFLEKLASVHSRKLGAVRAVFGTSSGETQRHWSLGSKRLESRLGGFFADRYV